MQQVDAHPQDLRDKSRLCPACRMPISALATKCRYCGEMVTRPMAEEIRRLSVSDLGGVEGAQPVLNESVVDALDAFRREELERAAAERQQREEEMSRSWFARKHPTEKTAAPKDDMPKLDARNLELSEISLAPAHKTVHKRHERVWTKKLALAASFVAAVLLIWLGGGFVKAYIDSYLNRGAPKQEAALENPAVALLYQPGRTLDALQAAVDAVRNDPNNSDNLRVLDQAREQVLKEADALLTGNPWSLSQLDRASALLARAVEIDTKSMAIKELKAAVDEEVYAYKMNVLSVDPASESATIRIVYPNRPEDRVIKKKDEIVNGRFKVKRVGERSVIFEDPKRKDAAGLPRTFSISLDGIVSVQ